MLALGLAMPVVGLQAQDSTTERPNREGRGQGGDRPMPGLFGVIDANSDRKLDKAELAAAAEALKKLDKDSDGKLTMGEIRGARGRGPGGQGGEGNGGNRGSRAEGEDQAGQRPGGGGGGSLFAALDTNKDNSLDSTELKAAAAALAKLDKNSDGELTIEEAGVVRGRPGAPGGQGQGNRQGSESKAGDKK